MKKFVEPMIPDTYYHVYNRACGFDKIFLEDKNYHFFMDLLKERMLEFIDLYCYCLIPNHFHMLVRTKPAIDHQELEYNYSRLFGNLFAAYAQSFNNYYNRKGSLFSQNFRRKSIESDNYLKTVVIYIHRNPIKHGLVDNLSQWKYSSYQEYTNGHFRYCSNPEVMDWFYSKDNFEFCHTLDQDSDIE